MERLRRLVLLCVLLLAISFPCFGVMNRPTVRVTTKLGTITGTEESIGPDDGYVTESGGPRIYHGFRGIPYAKPPVGELRWKDPVPFGFWSKDLDATNFGNQCPQYDRVTGRVMGDEDCLFLNIFTPVTSVFGRTDEFSTDGGQDEKSRRISNKSLLPVMVWFHGGGYVRGGSQQFGPQFLMREDIILVTVNYRLGVLGFLSTGDVNLPGNYGMLDQVEALRWVQNHISSFGGDPQSVTIFGESAGAAITHLLALSPLASGLIHKFISQSASALCDWSVEKNPLEYTLQVADGLKCSRHHSASMIECLRQQSVESLVQAQTNLLRYSLFPVRSAPVLDAHSRDRPFLPEYPQDIISKRGYRPIPMMSGLNPDEGLLFYLWIHYENMAKMGSKTFLEQELVPGVIASLMKNSTQSDSTIKVIQEQYFGNIDYGDTRHFVPRFSQLIEDISFTSCVYAAQLMHANTSAVPSYAYLFSYKGQKTPSYSEAFANFVRMSGFDHPILNTGVTHADELLYLFRMAGLNAAYSPRDMQMSQIMTRLWTSFARTGNPLAQWPYPSVIPRWPHVSINNGLDGVIYLNLDLPVTILGLDFRKAEHNFWVNVIPHVRNTAAVAHQKNYDCLAALWSILSLLIFTIIIMVALSSMFALNKRKRRYPERGVVAQRNT